MVNAFEGQSLTVVKLGGSLFNLPNLGIQLESFLQLIAPSFDFEQPHLSQNPSHLLSKPCTLEHVRVSCSGEDCDSQSLLHSSTKQNANTIFELDAEHFSNRTANSRAFSRPILLAGGGAFADVVRELDRVHNLGNNISHVLGTHTLSLSARLIESLSKSFTLTDNPEDFTEIWKHQRVPVFDATETSLKTSALPPSWDVTSDSIAAWIASRNVESQLVFLKSTNLPETISFQDAAEKGLVDNYFPNIAKSVSKVYWCNFRSQRPTLQAWSSESAIA